MSALPKIAYYTPQEYLRLEREADYKSEYFKGEIYEGEFIDDILNGEFK